MLVRLVGLEPTRVYFLKVVAVPIRIIYRRIVLVPTVGFEPTPEQVLNL